MSEPTCTRYRRWFQPLEGSGARRDLRQHLVERRQEAVVLLTGAVGDAHVALIAEGRAPAHDHAALAEPAHHVGFLALAERDPREVRLAVGRVEPAFGERLLEM